MVLGSGGVSTLTILGLAYEGGGHLLSFAAFPSTNYTQILRCTLNEYTSFRVESTQKPPFGTILVPDGIWTHDLRIRSLAC